MQMMPLAYSSQTLCYLNDSQNSIFTQNHKCNVHVVPSKITLLTLAVVTLIHQHVSIRRNFNRESRIKSTITEVFASPNTVLWCFQAVCFPCPTG